MKIKCDKLVSTRGFRPVSVRELNVWFRQLSSTKGSRYVLASAEESWARIQALCVRVQDLEYALDKAHALVTNASHPLLDVELKKIGQDPRAVIKGNSSNATS
ncbi:6743_t:CDS:2, partial [Acaulospora colombiana]